MTLIKGSRRTARRLRADAVLQNGTSRLNAAGDCSTPVERFYRGFPDPALRRLDEGWFPLDRTRVIEPDNAVVLFIYVRCRRCEACLRHRSRLWSARGAAETVQAARTWFGTLTFRPEVNHATLAWCRKHHSQQGVDFDQLSASDQFVALVRRHSEEVTRFLKRLRKHARSGLRYLLVWEPHKTGLPHVHLLLHEAVEGAATKRMMESSWWVGFSHWRLVHERDARASFYVSKYIAKSASARIRASQGYGRLRPIHSVKAEYVHEVTRDISPVRKGA